MLMPMLGYGISWNGGKWRYRIYRGYDSPTCDADVDVNGIPMMRSLRPIPKHARTHIRRSRKKMGREEGKGDTS